MLNNILRIFVAAFLLTSCSNDESVEIIPPPEPYECIQIIETDKGDLVGAKASSDACGYYGISFGQTTEGENRFKRPVPVEPWEGVYQATTMGDPCPQSFGPLGIVGSEDCLSLNVWRPAHVLEKPLPVMVFLFGGGFEVGAGSWAVYNGSDLTKKDVIVVTTNYRLGATGFLAHPALRDEDPDGSFGNWAFFDQMATLDWVKKNISQFGGDPNNVTLFGQSAGAWSVCTLLTSPLAKGLFHKGIIQSGGCNFFNTVEDDFVEGKSYAERLGCPANDENTLDCLRSLSLDELYSTYYGSINPHIDGYFLPESPTDALANGSAAQIPLIVGATNEEALLIIALDPDLLAYMSEPWESIWSMIEDSFGTEDLAKIKELYPKEDYATPFQFLSDVASDFSLICPAWVAAKLHRDYAPTFHYSFDWNNYRIADNLGSFHSWELGFVFGLEVSYNQWLLGLDEYKEAAALSEIMQTYWTNFAKTSDPNGPGVPAWETFESDNTLLIDVPLSSVDNYNLERCNFWETRLSTSIGEIFSILGRY
jgi:para-nitrobenzyl esterase